MNRITSDYNLAQNKAALFAEIEARRSEGRKLDGINGDSKREDMEAALVQDDKDHAAELDQETEENAQVSAKATPQSSGNIPQVEADDARGDGDVVAPPDSAYSGNYRKLDDGLIYALAVDRINVRGHTHWAKNSMRLWDGTEAQFRAQFDKL